MAYVKIIFQNSPSTATPLNAQNLNHMDDQIALNDQRLIELEGAHVSSFNGRTGAVAPADGDYDIGQIAPLTGAQVGQVPVVTNIGTEEAPELVFRMGAGGGAGGHEIIDSEGSTMPQESAMQFPDSHVSDDSTNGRTVVENVKEVTLAELSQATERGMYLATDEESVPIGASSEDKVEVTGDGAKTLGQLLNAIYNDTKFDITKITKDTKLVVGTNVFFPTIINTDYNYARFTRETCNTSYLYIEDYTISSSSVAYFTTVNGSAYSRQEDTATIEPSGFKITLYYGTSSTVINLKTSADYCQYDENTTVKQAIDKLKEIKKTTVTGATNSSGVLTSSLGANKVVLSATRHDQSSEYNVIQPYYHSVDNIWYFKIMNVAGNVTANNPSVSVDVYYIEV